MRYFAKVTDDYWTAKNKLQADVKERFKEQDRKILDDENELKCFLELMIQRVIAANDAHPRCKRLVMHKHTKQDRVVLVISNVVTMKIWEEA